MKYRKEKEEMTEGNKALISIVLSDESLRLLNLS